MLSRGGGVTFRKSAHAGVHRCFEREPGSVRSDFLFRNLNLYILVSHPPPPPTVTHQREKGNVSHGRVHGSPFPPRPWGDGEGGPGSPPSGLVPPGTYLGSHHFHPTPGACWPGPQLSSDIKKGHLGEQLQMGIAGILSPKVMQTLHSSQ